MTKLTTSSARRIHILAVALVVLASITACTKGEELQTDNNIKEHRIDYSIGLTTATTILKDTNSWNRMLDWLVYQSATGAEVSFYGTYHDTKTASSKPLDTKSADTCRTTNRDEIITWCRKMELEGKTVTLTYDRVTGTYTGTAYARRFPPRSYDPRMLVGRWDLEEMTVAQELANDNHPTTQSYTFDNPVVDIRRWVFNADGTVHVTLNRNASDDTPNVWETYTLEWKVTRCNGVADGDRIHYRYYALLVTGYVDGEEYSKTWLLTDCTETGLMVQQNTLADAFIGNMLVGDDMNVRTTWCFARTVPDKAITKDSKEQLSSTKHLIL